MKEIKGIEVLQLQIVFYCIVEPSQYDLGAVTLYCEDRNFILDAVRSSSHEEDNGTVITCELEVDEDTFPVGENYHVDGDGPLNYDFKLIDFDNPNFKGTFYIGDSYETAPESVTLMIRYLNEDGTGGMYRAIELELE